MKIGCCVGYKDIEKIKAAAKAGYDYVEVVLSSYSAASQEECTRFVDALRENNIPCEAANCLFPKEIQLCSDAFDEKQVAEYLEKAFSRARETGIDTIVFGSGRSRTIPEGFPREKATEQLEKVCINCLDPIGKKYGITVVIEPLNKKECNIFNTVEESAAFVNKLGLCNVKVLADTYHMDVENEPYSNVLLTEGILRHTHIANPDGRVVPLCGDTNDYSEFFKSLKKINYCGRMSVEAGIPKDKSQETALAESLAFLRSLV